MTAKETNKKKIRIYSKFFNTLLLANIVKAALNVQFYLKMLFVKNTNINFSNIDCYLKNNTNFGMFSSNFLRDWFYVYESSKSFKKVLYS